jgi:hypothetical protein
MKTYRPKGQGIREVEPRPKGNGRVLITERTSPTIRTVQGWLMPLEHYDERLRLSPLQQYLELLLMMASKRPVDAVSMRTVLRQARNSLDDEQYDRLLEYHPMFDVDGTVVRGSASPPRTATV